MKNQVAFTEVVKNIDIIRLGGTVNGANPFNASIDDEGTVGVVFHGYAKVENERALKAAVKAQIKKQFTSHFA